MDEKITQTTQEYLETIYKLKKNGGPVSVAEIADYMKTPPLKVNDELKKLEAKDYVKFFSSQGVTLTDSGSIIGRKMNRKHRLLESLLHNVLKIGNDIVHQEACEMEHSLSDQTETALCQFLGHPDKCPDGQPIQPCDLPFASCEECMAMRAKGMEQVGRRNANLTSLADLKEHEEGRVAFIRADSRVLRRLLDMGITTNTTVHIIKSAPFGGPVELAVRGSKLALGRDIASDVFVETNKNGERGEKK